MQFPRGLDASGLMRWIEEQEQLNRGLALAGNRARYFEALTSVAPTLPFRGQAPGHGGVRLLPEVTELISHFAMNDMSVAVGVDVSAKPGQPSPLQEAESDMAALYGAEEARFLTTGASGAAKAMFMAIFEAARGGTILVQGSVHISIWDVATMLGAKLVVVAPKVNPLGFSTVMTPEDLEQALNDYPDVRGIIASSPSYEGAVGAMERWVQIAHSRGIPIGIDQSWGPDLGFHPDQPQGAVKAGADFVATSQHKVWPGVPGQMASALRPKGSLVSSAVFGSAVRMHQSTSKSSIFIAALDWARRFMALYGRDLIDATIGVIREEEEIFRAAGLGHLLVDWTVPHLPHRAVFNTSSTGYTGFELEPLMMARGVQIAQPNIAFFCSGFGVGATDEVRATFAALREIIEDLRSGKLEERPPITEIPRLPLRTRRIDLREVLVAPFEVVRLEEAVGRRGKYAVGGYPPGIVVGAPGEELTLPVVRYLMTIEERGARKFGPPAAIPPGHIAVLRG
jgi:arginine decarboxylase